MDDFPATSAESDASTATASALYGYGARLLCSPWSLITIAVLVLLAFIEASFDSLEKTTLFGFSRLQESLTLVLLVVLFRTAAREHNLPMGKLSGKQILRFVLFSLFLWANLDLTTYVFISTEIGLSIEAATVLGLHYFVLTAYHFYFVPILLGAQSFGVILRTGFRYFQEDKLLALRTVTGPFGLAAFLTGIALMFDPHQQTVTSHLLKEIASIFQAVTVVALACSAAILQVHCALPTVVIAKVTQTARTYEKWGHPLVRRLLSAKTGAALCTFGLATSYLGILRIDSTPTNISFVVRQLEVADKLLRVTITAEDEEHYLRGFRPCAFSLGGPRQPGTIAESCLRIKEGDSRISRLTMVQHLVGPQTYTIEFELDRTTDEIRQIADLSLWYEHELVTSLATASAPTITSPLSPPEEVVPLVIQMEEPTPLPVLPTPQTSPKAE
jgi:hypothetical protein